MPTTSASERPMKTLLILRHAKTQSDAPAGDHARELTERGHRNAAAMGAYIQNLIGTPDVIITSDATRARRTAEIVAPAVAFAAPFTVEPRIYAADLATLSKGCACRPRGSPSSSSTSIAGTPYERAEVACVRWPRRARSPDRSKNFFSLRP